MPHLYGARFYYGAGAHHPKKRGDLAIEMWADSESSLSMDVNVGLSRDDIGEVVSWGPDFHRVWKEDA